MLLASPPPAAACADDDDDDIGDDGDVNREKSLTQPNRLVISPDEELHRLQKQSKWSAKCFFLSTVGVRSNAPWE